VKPRETPVSIQPRRQSADISELLLELAEIVEERREQTWRADAACRNRPTWMWFPARGDRDTLERALKVCRSCFVREQCRAANIDKRDGIYGGLTGAARRELRRADQGTLRKRRIIHGTNAGYTAHLRAGEDACLECRQAHAIYVQDNKNRARGAA
jgi:hypothetical protein